MTKISSIKSSAQARLILYKLLSEKLKFYEEQILSHDFSLINNIILKLDEESINRQNADKEKLNRVFAFIEQNTKEGLAKQMKQLTGQELWLGVFPQALLDNFIEEHKLLIKDITEEHRNKIALSINRGIREGKLLKDIRKDIEAQTGLSKKRAQLIARNAPLQYSGAITRHHQTNAGIKEYIWQTSHDERVRKSHRVRDGKVYDWAGPGPHPRSEVNCRCDAVPVWDF